MPLRTVRVKLKAGRQTIGVWDTVVDPKDDAVVRALLADLLRQRGIDDPTPEHRVELYGPGGKWIREVSAA